ncbi:hypothetical protein ACP4OV_004886 [Aristida adscensionis]
MACTYRIYCRASDVHSLAIVDGEVVLATADPRDDRQVWFKDLKFCEGLKDEEGSPAFALVNKATGEALKHSFGHNCPVRAIKFDPGFLDESIMWAESDVIAAAGGFRRVHMINNTDYVFDAEHVAPGYGDARDGTRLLLFRWHGGLNQMWRIAPRSALEVELEAGRARLVGVLWRSDPSLRLTVRDGAAVLARADSKDGSQCWVQSFRNAGHVTDGEGHRAFALVNWATGKALRHGRGEQSVQLVGDSPDSVEVAMLWTQGDDLGEGFHALRTVGDVGLVLDAADAVPESGGAHDGTPIIVFPWHKGPNQQCQMVPV